MQKVVKY